MWKRMNQGSIYLPAQHTQIWLEEQLAEVSKLLHSVLKKRPGVHISRGNSDRLNVRFKFSF